MSWITLTLFWVLTDTLLCLFEHNQVVDFVGFLWNSTLRSSVTPHNCTLFTLPFLQIFPNLYQPGVLRVECWECWLDSYCSSHHKESKPERNWLAGHKVMYQDRAVPGPGGERVVVSCLGEERRNVYCVLGDWWRSHTGVKINNYHQPKGGDASITSHYKTVSSY